MIQAITMPIYKNISKKNSGTIKFNDVFYNGNISLQQLWAKSAIGPSVLFISPAKLK